MVLECGVLLRIEHFKQSRRWIPPEIHAHLIDFVEQEDRIDSAGFLDHLNDLARKRANVGAAMATDFGFVAYSA